MVLWAVLTPLVLFLVLVPGYVVATYVKYRMTLSKDKSGRLLGDDRTASYYTQRPTMIRERLQERSSLNVPNAVKRTKHLRATSSITAGTLPPLLPATKSILLQQPPLTSRHFRRNSSPISSVIVTPQHHPDLLETYSPYQIKSAPASCDEKSPDETPSRKRESDSNNNGQRIGKRHLEGGRGHFYAAPGGGALSPFIIPMKMEPVRKALKIDLPEIVDKP